MPLPGTCPFGNRIAARSSALAQGHEAEVERDRRGLRDRVDLPNQSPPAVHRYASMQVLEITGHQHGGAAGSARPPHTWGDAVGKQLRDAGSGRPRVHTHLGRLGRPPEEDDVEVDIKNVTHFQIR